MIWLRLYFPRPGRMCFLICALYTFTVEYFLSNVYSFNQMSNQSLRVSFDGSRYIPSSSSVETFDIF